MLPVPKGRRFGIAVARTREPPAAHLDRAGRVAKVDDTVELMVPRIAGLEVGCAAGQVYVLPVGEPQGMDAARGRAGRVEEADRTGSLGLPDVEDLEAGRRQPELARLVGDDEQVTGEVEGV